MQLIDTHTHLYLPEFESDRDVVINKAIERGVSKFFLPNIDSGSIASMLALSRAFPKHCFSMMGLHPCSVNEHYEEELNVVEYWLQKSFTGVSPLRFYAVGEIGMDLYWDKTFLVQQKYAFKKQIELAKKYQLPIVIHTRNSFEEAYEIVSEMNDEKLSGIFHCFSGTYSEAEKIISLKRFKLGIGGVLTFKNSGLDKVIKDIPLEHLVLETDAPYLAPVPYRGKRNESSYIIETAKKIAEIKEISLEKVAEVTTNTALQLFKIQ